MTSASNQGGGSRQRRSRSDGAAEGEAASAAMNGKPHPRLLDTYRNEIVPTMMTEFGFPNVMRVPRIQKIVLNIGLGEALTNGGRWKRQRTTWRL